MVVSTSKYVAAIMLAGFLGGCSLAPQYARPDLPVAGQMPAVSGKTTESAKVVDANLGWQDFFQDPQLRHIIQTALNNNRNLRVSALNVAEYEAQYRIQRAALLPTVTASGYGTRQRAYASGVYGTGTAYGASVGMTSYELDLFGKIRNLKDEALENYLSMEETNRSAQISLVAEVASAYLTWITDRELLAITEDTLKNENESYQLTQQRAQMGAATQLDLAQARTSLESARSNQAQYQRQVAQDLNSLNLLVGSKLPDLQTPPKQLDNQLTLAAPPAHLSSTVLLQRPDVQAAEHTLKGANAQIGAARAAFFPSISLTATAGKASSDLNHLFDHYTGVWEFTPSISLPIFTAGRLRAELDVAKIKKDISVANYEHAIQSAFREVADALVGGETYGQQMVAQKAELDAAQTYYNLARQRYEQGLDSFLTLLDAQRSLYSARRNYVSLQLAAAVNRISLYKALGGGWSRTTQPQKKTLAGPQ